ncbi:MAG: alkaline phosphatase family protein [Clostridia bacterium]|nr:alkaline phosphatase family protein [Clostridia bacterium]
MKLTKKALTSIIASAVLLLVVGVALSVYFTWYMHDSKDTESAYRANVAKVGYQNTIETAIPQTAIYNAIVAHFNSELPVGKTEKKAIIIGMDGCRADVLTEMQSSNSIIGTMLQDGASINLAYCGGVNYPEKNTQDTSTAPGWCSILTGVWATEHGITGNDISKDMSTKILHTSLTEQKIIDSAVFNTKWAGHFSRKNATYLNEKQYAEDNNLPIAYNKYKNNEVMLEETIAELRNLNCADFTFVIYEPTDAAGHGYGFTINNPRYKNAFIQGDDYGYQTLCTIKARETFAQEDWLVIVTSDHGGYGIEHGEDSIQERMTFIVANRY